MGRKFCSVDFSYYIGIGQCQVSLLELLITPKEWGCLSLLPEFLRNCRGNKPIFPFLLVL